MCILNTRSAIKRMGVKQFKDFISENCYRRIRFTKENSYYSMRCQKKKDLLLVATNLTEKIIDGSNAK